jgi:hypothetical protein
VGCFILQKEDEKERKKTFFSYPRIISPTNGFLLKNLLFIGYYEE